MHDEMENKDKGYLSLSHKEWYDLMSTMEVKDNRKRAAYQIKILAAQKVVLVDYDINTIPRVTHKKKAGAGVLLDRNQQGKKTPKHKGYQHYFAL